MGVSSNFVHRVWPEAASVGKLQASNDPHLVEKIRDVVACTDPPDKVLILCADEKSQIQALDRTQPSLPMNYGMPETHTHDSRRQGTTTLFAALEVATGEVTGKLKRCHRSTEHLSFLRHRPDVPDDLGIHLILDNYGTHNQDGNHSDGPNQPTKPLNPSTAFLKNQRSRTLEDEP